MIAGVQANPIHESSTEEVDNSNDKGRARSASAWDRIRGKSEDRTIEDGMNKQKKLKKNQKKKQNRFQNFEIGF